MLIALSIALFWSESSLKWQPAERFQEEEYFKFVVCFSLGVLLKKKKDVWLEPWHLELETDAETIRSEWLVIFAITARLWGFMWCTVPSPILQQGRGRLSFQFHFQHIQLHIHLIALWPFKLLPLLCDDVWYEQQTTWNGKMQAGDINRNKKKKKKLTDWRKPFSFTGAGFYLSYLGNMFARNGPGWEATY